MITTMLARKAFLFLAIISLAVRCSPEPPVMARRGELTIAAASSLRPALDAMIELWNREHPAVPARATYAASGVLYAQIGSEAPFDLFLSADDVYPLRTYENGRGSEPFRFATGRLAAWVPEGIDPITGLDQLTRPRFRKIAVASPSLAPYGEAAIEALEGAGVYDALKGQLLYAGNVMEAAHFAESGGAQAALVSLSLVVATSLRSRGTYLVIPDELHEPIIHEGTVLVSSPNPDAAQEFVAMLRSPEAGAILEASGFVPEEPEGRTGDE